MSAKLIRHYFCKFGKIINKVMLFNFVGGSHFFVGMYCSKSGLFLFVLGCCYHYAALVLCLRRIEIAVFFV